MIRKLSPCRVIPIAAALLLLTGICYMLWQHSFAATPTTVLSER